jgi:hypothetical protein
MGNKMWVKDPWLSEKQGEKGESQQGPVNYLTFYPSPEKIEASNNAYMDYN